MKLLLLTSLVALSVLGREALATAQSSSESVPATVRASEDPPLGYLSEVIPIRFAQASEIATAINSDASKALDGVGGIVNLGQQKIIPDDRSNSVLIYAEREELKALKAAISKMDLAKAQVLIEAVIVQVSLDKMRKSERKNPGEETHAPDYRAAGAEAIGKSNLCSIIEFHPGAMTNALGEITNQLQYTATSTNDLDAMLTTFANDSRIKILQRPRIQTSHNITATLFVGESRPYPAGSSWCGGPHENYSTIQQIQTGVTLEVTPLMTPGDLVDLDIHQKIETPHGTVTIANVGVVPVTTRKELAAKVSVHDRDTIVLGGMLETCTSTNTTGVPLLKKIPALGALFRRTSTSTSHSELVVLIRTTILPRTALPAGGKKEHASDNKSKHRG